MNRSERERGGGGMSSRRKKTKGSWPEIVSWQGKKARLVAGDGEEVRSLEMGWARLGFGDSVGRPIGRRVLCFLEFFSSILIE